MFVKIARYEVRGSRDRRDLADLRFTAHEAHGYGEGVDRGDAGCGRARVFAPGKHSPPLVVIYEVVGKNFAILSVRGTEDVILKCDEALVSALRETYTGVGHRSHLDRRFRISVRLDADVPAKEIRRLVSRSYDLVSATLTAKQRTELARSTERARATGADDRI